MKLLKALVRTDKLEEVVRALEGAQAPGITVSLVQGVGHGYAPNRFSLSTSEMERAEAYAKVEVVCASHDVGRLAEALVAAARTGLPGDGIVFVTEVERAIRIRSGEEGLEVLRVSLPGTL